MVSMSLIKVLETSLGLFRTQSSFKDFVAVRVLVVFV